MNTFEEEEEQEVFRIFLGIADFVEVGANKAMLSFKRLVERKVTRDRESRML